MVLMLVLTPVISRFRARSMASHLRTSRSRTEPTTKVNAAAVQRLADIPP